MGRYVDENLMPGEKVVYEAQVHWGIYASAAVIAVLGLVAWPFLIVAALLALRAYLTRTSTELVITDRRIFAKFGFIRRTTFEKHIDKLEGINFDQGVIGRILGYGAIVVGGIGGSTVPVPFIENPQEFKNRLYQVIEQNKAKA